MDVVPPSIPPRPPAWIPPGQKVDPQRPTQPWQPPVGTTWQYVLAHPVKLDHSIEHTHVWIIDLFDNPAETVAELHRRGRKVVAYFSAGTFENWRSDAKQFPPQDIGRDLDDWDGEKWIMTKSSAIRRLMTARLDLAVEKGFDGVDPDNIDAYDNKTGLGLTKADAVDYVRFLAGEAHRRSLSCGLKNAGAIVKDVVDQVEYGVQEQCVQYDEAETYLPFIHSGKPVFHVEYPKGEDPDSKRHNNDHEVPPKQMQKYRKTTAMGFSTIVKNIKLDQWLQSVQ